MNDLAHASTLFFIFAAALILYGALIARSGNAELLPLRARHSIRGAEDVRRVGRYVLIVGVVIGAIALLCAIIAH